MAVMVRADMSGRVALGASEMNKLYAMHRDPEGVIHLRPLEEHGPEHLTAAQVLALPADAEIRDRYGMIRRVNNVGQREFTEDGPWTRYTEEDPNVG